MDCRRGNARRAFIGLFRSIRGFYVYAMTSEYFAHDYDARNDPKVVQLVIEQGAFGIACYWIVIEILHSVGGEIDRSKLVKLVCHYLHEPTEKVQLCMQKMIECELFTDDDTVIRSNRVIRNLLKRKEVAEKRSNAASKRYANAEQMQNKSNANAGKVKVKDKVKDKVKEEEGRGFRPPPLSEVVLMFDVRGMPADEAERFHAYYESQGWVKSNGRPVANWQSLIVPWQKKYLAERIPTKDEVETFARIKYPDRPDGTNPELRFAAEYYLTFQRQGWKLANGLPIADWRTGLIKYVNDQMVKVPA